MNLTANLIVASAFIRQRLDVVQIEKCVYGLVTAVMVRHGLGGRKRFQNTNQLQTRAKNKIRAELSGNGFMETKKK